MNATLHHQLREIDADLARDYDRIQTDMNSIEPRVGHEFMDDVDVLVDGLLKRLSRAEAEVEELGSEIHDLERQAVKDSEE